MDDLEASDPFLPPNADSAGALEVVPVHHNVDGEVESNRNPGNGSQADKLGVAQ